VRSGYGGASVAEVTARAGVSRQTFYTLFASREECGLAACHEAAVRLRRTLVAECAECDTGDRLGPLLNGTLRAVAADPVVAQLILLEALGADPSLRAVRESLVEEAASALGRVLVEDGYEPLRAPPRALLGGIVGILNLRLLDGAGEVESLGAGIEAWLRSYRVPRGQPTLPTERWRAMGAALAQPSPEDGDDSSRRPSSPDRHSRILAAVARVSRQKGYAAMTVADVVAEAGVSRESFYRCFGGKLDAFLAAQEAALHGSASVAGAFMTGGSWADRIWSGLDALLSYLARNPDLAGPDLVESVAAGHAAFRRTVENRMAFAVFLEEGYRQRPSGAALPRICSEAIAAAIHELMRGETVAGRPERLRELLPQAAYVALAPFLGAPEALACIEEKLSE
jgi:AcrR family transcriptional regulator